MNAAIVWNTFHRILTRPMVVLLLFAHVVFASILGFEHGNRQLNYEYWKVRDSLWITYTWALGAGLLGRDLSDGILPLIFSRPVSRAAYVLSRWAGLVLAVAAIMALDAALGTSFVGRVGHEVDLLAFLAGFGLSLLVVAATAALLTLLSSLAPGHGDLWLFLGAWLLLYLLTQLTSDKVFNENMAAIFTLFLLPGSNLFGSQPMTKDFFVYAWPGLEAAACLVLAIAVLKRREITYVMAS